VPDEHPTAWDTPNCSAAAAQNAATSLAKNELLRLEHAAERIQQLLMEGAYWRFRSSIGTGVRPDARAGMLPGPNAGRNRGVWHT
jgi:hypothetical protein